MAKEKKTPDDSAPRKAAVKKSPARKAAAPKPEKVVAAAAVAASGAPSRRAQPSEAELILEVRQRAYQLYCERGRHHGAHESDWHRAEREVRAKYNF